MASVDRSNSVRTKSSDSRYSLMEFMREFPDDETCLRWLWKSRCAVDSEGAKAFCPKCELDRPFHRVSSRPAWDCDYCGHHLHPTAGTIFHKSSTSLQLWFYAMFLASQTRCGISAKQLEREIGVTYKTAWRMLNKIRNQLMDEQDGEPLSGDVEVDETAYGGKPRRGDIARMQREGDADLSAAGGRWWQRKKTTVFAMVKRGGRVRAFVVPNRRRDSLQGEIVKYVFPPQRFSLTSGSPITVSREKFKRHNRIRHSEEIYVEGDVHTQTIEWFFGNLKRGIDGTYHAVSAKWLQGYYLNEFTWRYNRPRR